MIADTEWSINRQSACHVMGMSPMWQAWPFILRHLLVDFFPSMDQETWWSEEVFPCEKCSLLYPHVPKVMYLVDSCVVTFGESWWDPPHSSPTHTHTHSMWQYMWQHSPYLSPLPPVKLLFFYSGKRGTVALPPPHTHTLCQSPHFGTSWVASPPSSFLLPLTTVANSQMA